MSSITSLNSRLWCSCVCFLWSDCCFYQIKFYQRGKKRQDHKRSTKLDEWTQGSRLINWTEKNLCRRIFAFDCSMERKHVLVCFFNKMILKLYSTFKIILTSFHSSSIFISKETDIVKNWFTIRTLEFMFSYLKEKILW